MSGMTRILLATDYDSSSQAASQDALMLAALFGATLELCHAVPTLRDLSRRSRVHVQAHERLGRLASELADNGTPIGELRVAEGSAAEAILHTADALSSDLIVLAAGDRSPAGDTGPTAETVARFAKQPVWVSRPRARDARRVVCGVDHSGASREALRLARDLAEFLGASQRLFTESGTPRDVLLRASEGAFVLVLGRNGVTGLRRVFLGGTAERLLRRAPCSLLLTSPLG